MSAYTMQLRTVIERYSQEYPDLTLDERIEEGRKGLFSFDYPFFDKEYKKIFETNFIKYFYMHEIGQETDGLFKLRLDMWLNVNMFYYNKLYESEQLKFNPLENVNVQKERKRSNKVDETDSINRKGSVDSTSNSSSDSSEQNTAKQTDKGFNRDIQSDTPEKRLQITTGAEGTGVIEYASGIAENKSSGTSDSSGTRSGKSTGTGKASSDMSNTENKDRNVTENESESWKESGKTGSQTYQDMILEYRKTFVNVERQIFENMRKDGLFMLIYG